MVGVGGNARWKQCIIFRMFMLKVADCFVKFYTDFLGSSMQINPICDPNSLFVKKLSRNQANSMIRMVTNEEIESSIFSIGDDKAPGPDDYSTKFFKEAWDIVGKDVCDVVHDFFINGQLLKEINASIISLIPKVTPPDTITDFRPISCCNVIYKCISKLSWIVLRMVCRISFAKIKLLLYLLEVFSIMCC